jgi:isocitrate dehydrogenase (NAD+)
MQINKYGNRFIITLIPGDGIGTELCNSVKRIFEKALVPIDWDEVCVKNDQDYDKAIQSIKRNKICLKGNNYLAFKERDFENRKNQGIFV